MHTEHLTPSHCYASVRTLMPGRRAGAWNQGMPLHQNAQSASRATRHFPTRASLSRAMTDLAPSAPGSSDDFRTRLENDIYKQRAAQEATEKLQLVVEFAVHKQQSKQQIEHLEQRVEQLEQQLAAARKESTQKIEQLEQQLAASIAAEKDSTQRIEQLEQQLAASAQETDKERAAKIAAETALAAALASGSKSQQVRLRPSR